MPEAGRTVDEAEARADALRVTAIDHVNIETADVEGLADFYGRLLGLERGVVPVPSRGAWLIDHTGNAIVHLRARDENAPSLPADAPTGAFNHVAFRCQGFEGALARIRAMGIPFRVAELAEIGLRQIVVRDPANIKIELNFNGD